MSVSTLAIVTTALLAFEAAAMDAAAVDAAVVDFDTEIVPVLTKAGCNAGSCHGSAAGRGGFKLSLLGADAAADYQAIVRQSEGRRVNLAHAKRSLVLAKPIGMIDHGGGTPLDYDGPGAARLEAWLAAGAPRGGGRRLLNLEVQPTREVIDRAGRAVQIRAIATYSDGSSEDVTGWTVFTAADADAVRLDHARGTATPMRPGQNVVVARFLDRVTCIQLIVPMGTLAADAEIDAPSPANFIDAEIDGMLAVLGLATSPPADDAAFLRRATLDLTGKLPTSDEVRQFLADPSHGKRERLIDRLLASEAFVDYWTYKLATLLRVRSPPNEPQVAVALDGWIRQQLTRGEPWDAMVQSLVLATGDTHEVGPAGFARLSGDARSQAEHLGEAFLGVRLACANCHNHPLDRWTQEDYHGLAAVFARLERNRVVAVAARGGVSNPKTGEPATPRLPGERDLPADEDGRAAFAEWLTSSGNQLFARATVNRLWKALMGRGLVEPVDDLRQTNPATHPELLDRLAEDFVAHGFDLRHTLRQIATSAAYGRASTATSDNAADDRFYSHALARPLEPEVLLDAVADVTGVNETFGDEPQGTRAVRLVDPKIESAALDILGRCGREASCDASGASSTGLATTLHLVNGELVNGKLAADEGIVHQMLVRQATDEALLEELYLRALSRMPRDRERAYWQDVCREASTTQERLALWQDIAWSVLNSREFTTNH